MTTTIIWNHPDGTPKTTAELFEDIREMVRQGATLVPTRDGFDIVPPERH
jgi:hypothetical protein